MKTESGRLAKRSFALTWLKDKPKPLLFVPDNANSFLSQEFRDYMDELNIHLATPAEKEAWAHGLIEAAVQDIKATAESI